MAAGAGFFLLLSDDVVLNILARLESDPRDWARLSCVSTRFAFLVCNVCCRAKCLRSLPDLVSEIAAADSGGWASLFKLSVCCPGLLSAGILLENSDFGLEREIGPDENYPRRPSATPPSNPLPPASSSDPPPADCWSLFDDLYFDTIYDVSEVQTPPPQTADNLFDKISLRTGHENSLTKKKTEWVGPVNQHLASGAWNLRREQGSKLLASRFRSDSLYLCDWPGCIHAEEKRNYMLFRGVFMNFKRSRVWRTINDSNRGKIEIECAFCSCKQTWDLHSAFCLRRVFGFHDDGEPVVRAYVCENGHVAGAWTEWPSYS
ncbi:Phytochrome A-associated F-box protein [Apostasia shenzhenica]|uniref:Phytochrome A-associated F-box protein n=1 Tax=Apostasia shenzhenica TaxID=1088818 RepID=A0A2I0A624_9ASPA|nr:Phytochrome A-associated F-box protein [Apostasia shenzhenica]